MKLRWFFVGVLFAVGLAARAERIQAVMLTVPEKTIVLDRREDDWVRLGEAFTAARMAPDFTTNLLYVNVEEGEYAGPEDFFFEAWAAVDRDNLYVLTRVYDQLLFHDATRERIYEGDDLEIFIDANPPDMLFGAKRNENCRQIILLAHDLSSTQTGENAIWSDAPAPGIEMASRLRPWGYVLEVKIPKAIFPNWQANPAQDRIGFDLTVNDSDAAGVDSHHGPMKYVGYLLNPGLHFQTNEFLSMLVASEKTASPGKAARRDPILRAPALISAIRKAKAADAEMLAGQILDFIGASEVGQVASAAVASEHSAIRSAGLLVFAKRAELPMPIETIITALTQPLPAGVLFDPTQVNYALVALARRQALPVNDEFHRRFGASFSITVRHTYAWCLGENGDLAAVPFLLKQLADSNMRVRVRIAWALGKLGDPAALPALQEMAVKDHRYAQDVAKEAVAMIENKE